MRRKQFDVMKKMKLSGPEWCDVLGVIMVSPGGWPGPGGEPSWTEFRKKIDLSGFVSRAFPSLLQFEEGARDLGDCECYAAEDQLACARAPFVV